MKHTDKTNDQPSSENNARRTSIKTLVTATVVSGVWAKPVINSIVLPAHAETTLVTTTPEPVVCPDIVLELVADPVNSGDACFYRFTILSSDPGVPLTITSITDDLGATNLGVSLDDPLPAEATTSSGVGFTVQAARADVDIDDICFPVIQDRAEIFNIIVEFSCEDGDPRSLTFPLIDFVDIPN